MLNDISGKGSGEDPTDSIDREMEDKPEKKPKQSKKKDKKPKEKIEVQTEQVQDQEGAEEDEELKDFIKSKEQDLVQTDSEKSHKKYTQTLVFKQQKQLLSQIEKVYKDEKYDAQKKVMTFTSEICMPEIIKLQKQQESSPSENPEEQTYLSIQNDQDKEVMPLVCFYNALSFLKRLPSLAEISEPDKKIDLLAGYRMKDSFIELKNSEKSKCQSDL